MSYKNVVAKHEDKVLVILPHTSNGAYGTWVLPQVEDLSEIGETLNRAIGYDGHVSNAMSDKRMVINNGEPKEMAFAIIAELDKEPTLVHCSIDVVDERYPGMLFPAYVQAQLVTPEKAVRMLKRGGANAIAHHFGIELPKRDNKKNEIN